MPSNYTFGRTFAQSLSEAERIKAARAKFEQQLNLQRNQFKERVRQFNAQQQAIHDARVQAQNNADRAFGATQDLRKQQQTNSDRNYKLQQQIADRNAKTAESNNALREAEIRKIYALLDLDENGKPKQNTNGNRNNIPLTDITNLGTNFYKQNVLTTTSKGVDNPLLNKNPIPFGSNQTSIYQNTVNKQALPLTVPTKIYQFGNNLAMVENAVNRLRELASSRVQTPDKKIQANELVTSLRQVLDPIVNVVDGKKVAIPSIFKQQSDALGNTINNDDYLRKQYGSGQGLAKYNNITNRLNKAVISFNSILGRR